MAKDKCDICQEKMGVCTARLHKCGCVDIQPGERLNGIQEVIGSIPLISTRTQENIKFSGVFLFQSSVFIVKISLFRTGALHPGSRYFMYQNRTRITTIPRSPIRSNERLSDTPKMRWKISRLRPAVLGPAHADSAWSYPHPRVRQCSGSSRDQHPASASGKHRCADSNGASEPVPPP